MGNDVHLRPIGEEDLEMLVRFAVDRAFSLPHQWAGFRSPEGLRRRFEEDGFLERDPRQLAVALDDQTIGWVMWKESTIGRGGPGVWEIGALLAPKHRGQGHGTVAQQLLVDHLFETTPAHRLCALTGADNVVEQKALERAGFVREGVLREAGFLGGQWRDAVVYGLLRREWMRAPEPS
jgi:aminoglycoside 6'-N-acetyltransferase